MMNAFRQSLRPSSTSWRAVISVRAFTGCMDFSSYLVTPKELSESFRLQSKGRPKIIPLCASWFLPNDPEKRTGLAVYKAQRIPGARFFDLDEVKDHETPYPHMLPSKDDFATAMKGLGISKEDRVVVYDSKELGIFSAPRVAWTLKVFGHPHVHVLNNFKVWVEEGYPTESGDVPMWEQTDYPTPDVRLSEVVDFQTVRRNALMTDKRFQLLDARPQGRFDGTSPEPRPGLPSGHIPGSINVPFSDLIDPKTKTLLPSSKLREIFISKGVDFDIPIVSSCGTGVTAAVVDAALAESGHDQPEERSLYDGSWTEWAQRANIDEGLIVGKRIGS